MSGLKVSSLVQEYVFYRPDLTGKRVAHGTKIKLLKFKNILTNKAQRVVEGNEVICLVIFSPRVMVIKISRMAHFMYFLLDTRKYQSKFGQDIQTHLKGLVWLFHKILWIMYFGATISKISMFKNTGFQYSFVHAEMFLFTHNISRTVKSIAY